MARLEDHLKLTLLIDGVYQVKTQRVSLEYDGKVQETDTLEGLAGFTPGSKQVRIDATAAVPIGGPEFDFAKSVDEGSYHDLQIPFGSKSYVGNGRFMTAKLEGSTNANTEYSFTWVGQSSPPK